MCLFCRWEDQRVHGSDRDHSEHLIQWRPVWFVLRPANDDPRSHRPCAGLWGVIVPGMIFGRQELWFFLLTGFVNKSPTGLIIKDIFLKKCFKKKKVFFLNVALLLSWNFLFWEMWIFLVESKNTILNFFTCYIYIIHAQTDWCHNFLCTFFGN